MNERLYELIQTYEPVNEQEKSDKEMMLAYITTFADVTTRNNRMAHFTASSWIINPDFTKVLMIYHNIYRSWGWCGGHLDGDDDTIHVALKEGKEETGLKKLLPIGKQPLAIDILPVPPHIKHHQFVSSHVHLNITYLCMADETSILHCKPDENSGVKWIALEDIEKAVSEEDMKPVYEKLNHSTGLRLKKIK